MHPVWDGHPRGPPQGGHGERLLPSTPHTAVTSLAVVLHGDATVRAQEKPSLHASPGLAPLPGRRAGRGRGFGYPQGAGGPAVGGQEQLLAQSGGGVRVEQRKRAGKESRSER